MKWGIIWGPGRMFVSSMCCGSVLPPEVGLLSKGDGLGEGSLASSSWVGRESVAFES